MLDDGKTQKEIAEYFGVSPAAICKRVKRINMPESFKNLTGKEQKFVLARAEGKTQTQAALDSHDCSSLESAKSMGHQLMQKPDIQMAVSDLMQEEGLTRRHRVRTLKKHIDHADPNVSLKGLDQSWKLEGLYSEKHEHVHVTYEDLLCNYKDARAKRKELEKELGIDDETLEGEIIEND